MDGVLTYFYAFFDFNTFLEIMETQAIFDFWQIVKEWGALGILFILSWLLWWKLDRKDKIIYELIGVNKEIIDNQKQTLERLKELNENILKILTK